MAGLFEGGFGKTELRPYQPNLRDRVAQGLLSFGMPRGSVQGLLGSTGLGSEQFGLVDTPTPAGILGIPFAVDEAARAAGTPEGTLAAAALIPGAKAPGALVKRVAQPLRAFHGSPSSFEKFSSEHLLSGDGANAYGPGLYFAEAEEVARSYRDRLARDVSYRGRPFKEWNIHPSDGHNQSAQFHIAGRVADGEDPRSAIEGFAREYRQIAKERRDYIAKYPELRNEIESEAAMFESIARAAESENPADYARLPGSMYEVAIHANPDDFLDWDVPIGQQPKPIRQAARKATRRQGLRAADVDALQATLPSGGRNLAFEDMIRDPTTLRDAGIPGIKYRDAMSRGDSAAGTRNYVVFPGNDDLIEILRKYGFAGLMAGGGAAGLLGADASRPAQAAPQGLLGYSTGGGF